MQKGSKGRFSFLFIGESTRPPPIGTLRSKDGDGSENIAYKGNSRSSSLHRDSSNSTALSDVGELSWSWIH